MGQNLSRMLSTAAVLLSLFITPATLGKVPSSTSELEAAIAGLKNDLALGVQGVSSEARDGKFLFITAETCAADPDCYGNNPDSPYGIVFVPLLPGQPAPPALNKPFPFNTVPGMTNYTSIRPDEAIVILGWTPPSAKYFGFSPNMIARAYGHQFRKVFGTFGDAINNLTMKTSHPQDNQGGFTAIIYTPDANAEMRVRAALAAQGITADVVNRLTIPLKFPGAQEADLMRLGWDKSSDQLSLVLRIGLITDQAKNAEYMAGNPLRVLRVTPSRPATASQLPTPALRRIGNGLCEGKVDLSRGCTKTMDANLQMAYDGAIAEITTRFTALSPLSQKTRSIPMSPESVQAHSTYGILCITQGVDCNGDNRDALYSGDIVTTMLGRDKSEFIIVVGVNHVMTGKATYFNHALGQRNSAFVGSSFSDMHATKDGLTSIEYLLGRPARNTSELKLYAFMISRNCGEEPFCLSIPSEGPNSIPVEEEFGLFGRMYLEPATKTKPKETEILFATTLYFGK